MKFFAPENFFFRVSDKYYANFITHDPRVSGTARQIYMALFHACRKECRCWLSQDTLARICNKNIRTIQTHQRELEQLEYIFIMKQQGKNMYYLRLSEQLLCLLRKMDIPFHGSDAVVRTPATPAAVGHEKTASDTRERGEKISSYIRRDQEYLNTPLSPLRKPVPERSASRNVFPSRQSSPGQRVQRGGELSSGIDLDFERLWAAWPQTARWPMPCNRQLARRIFGNLSRTRQVPGIEKLLQTVELYKSTDSRWLNGYPPELSNWLHTRQFENSPMVRTAKKPMPPDSAATALSLEKSRELDVYKSRIEAMKKQFSSPPTRQPAKVSSADLEPLLALWPDPECQRIPVSCYFQYLATCGKRLDFTRILPAARAYLAATCNPGSLVGWLRNTACAG